MQLYQRSSPRPGGARWFAVEEASRAYELRVGARGPAGAPGAPALHRRARWCTARPA